MEKLTLIFPSSYFDAHAVDEDLKEEYDAAADTGRFDILLFSYEKWFEYGKLVITTPADHSEKAVYRGWMMKPEIYREFYRRLKENGLTLVTSPEEYERFHIFPNIYPAFGGDTAKMLVYDDKPDLKEIKRTFSRFMVKDFVKSVKGTDFPKYFDSDISEEEFSRRMELFYKYRANLLTGGICIKEYLDLKTYGGKTNEFRVFYMNGKAATVSRNSNQSTYLPEPPRELIERYEGLASPFYTIDYAELSDGSWKIIEAGDGQVSGLSPNQDYGAFFRLMSFFIININGGV